MTEENNNIFLAGGDALVYLTEPMHKKYFTKFVWGNPFDTYLSYDQFFNSPSPVHTCTHFGWPPSSIPLVAYGIIILDFMSYLSQCFCLLAAKILW